MSEHIPATKRMLRKLINFLVFLFFDVRKEGTFPDTPVLLAPNHWHWADPFILSAVYPPDLSVMAKKELFDVKIIAKIFGVLQIVPVDRQNMEMSTIRTSIDLAKRMSLLIFPEGTRNKDLSRPLPAKPGVTMIAVRSGLPIVPVAITKKPRLFSKITVIFLDPVDPQSYGFERWNSKNYQTVADDVIEKVYQAIRGYHADQNR